jgi:trans-aconitate methyltransferase
MPKAESAGYDWDAEGYSKASLNQLRMGLELLSKLALRGDERVLDIGCGDGKLTAEMAARLPSGSVLGIDSCGEMIAFARRKYPPETNPGLSWQVMDVRLLDLGPEFDIIFSNAALHWVIDHREVLKRLEKALKPGGRLLLQMGGRGNVTAMGVAMARVMGSAQWVSCFKGFSFPYGFYGPEEYAGWLREARLLPVRLEILHKDMSFGTEAALAGWIRTTWMPFTSRVPEPAREDFISQVVQTFVESNPAGEDGSFHIDARRLEVEAEKPSVSVQGEGDDGPGAAGRRSGAARD